MTQFTPLVKKKFEFDGSEIFVTFSRMKRKHVMKLIPMMAKFQEGRGEVEGDEKGQGDVRKLDEATADILSDLLDSVPQYIKSIDGLLDADGNEVSKETVFEDMYFLDLSTDIAMAVFDESTVFSRADVKN